MKPWAAVVRVSHLGDRKVGSDTFHADREQLEPIKAWANAKGVPLEVMDPELGVSGGLPLEQRPSLLQAIEGVERGDYAGVVVAYLSRLGRNVAEQLRAWDRVEKAGGKIVTIREGIDTSTASGRLHRNLLISIDAHEREQHAERFEERRRLATAQGIWQRRQTPTGYRRDEHTRRLVPDQNADAVANAFSDYLAGAAIVELARRVGMSPSGVRQLMRNRVYLGELRVGKHINQTAHPPLIDVETFETVQHKLDQNVRPARVAGREPALLAGLCRCASCGHVMARGNSNGGFAYLCHRNHSGGACPGPSAVMTTRLDPYVERIALAQLEHLKITASEGDQVENARTALEEAERELDAYLEAVSPTDVGAEAFNRAARVRRAAVDMARDQLRLELARRPVMPTFTTGAEAWRALGVAERNVVLRGLLETVVVRPAGRGRRVAIEDRVRVLSKGTPIKLVKRQPGGILPIPFPDADGVGVLRVATGEQSAQHRRSGPEMLVRASG